MINPHTTLKPHHTPRLYLNRTRTRPHTPTNIAPQVWRSEVRDWVVGICGDADVLPLRTRYSICGEFPEIV